VQIYKLEREAKNELTWSSPLKRRRSVLDVYAIEEEEETNMKKKTLGLPLWKRNMG
jgi:hypothetical protein